MKTEKTYHLFTFFSLYIAQAIPMSFFATVLPVLMRQGEYSLLAIALLKLIKLPWIFKFLWSPWVDSRTDSVRDYKRWIIGSEIIYALIIFGVAFLNLRTEFALIIGLVVFAFVASATQDIATDAMAARSFERKDSSLLNSMQTMGLFTGRMVGGGFLLMLFHRVGWGKLLPFVALFVLAALVPLVLNRNLKLRKRETKNRANWKDSFRFFAQKGIWKHVVFLFLFYSGLIGILSTLTSLMVDLKYSMAQIGVMVGIFGSAVGIVCSFLSGLLIRRIGKDRARRIISVVIVFVAAYFLCFTLAGGFTRLIMIIGIVLVWGTYGMASTMVYTASMDIVRDGREGTDFTMQIVIAQLSSMIVAFGCSRFGDMFGFVGLFAFELLLALVSCIYVWIYQSKVYALKSEKGEGE
ncbi:MAG: MFS transporter [Dysgonamonadaceae bacterium]|jgi:predicted MFS family arabinose efflux permease|nr:MFS transporter [Dysgonamonadaceae bacterium]